MKTAFTLKYVSWTESPCWPNLLNNNSDFFRSGLCIKITDVCNVSFICRCFGISCCDILEAIELRPCYGRMKKWSEKSHLLNAERKIFSSLGGQKSSEVSSQTTSRAQYDSLSPEEPQSETHRNLGKNFVSLLSGFQSKLSRNSLAFWTFLDCRLQCF